MAFTKKIWGFVAASVVTVPGVGGERPHVSNDAAGVLEEDQGRVSNDRAANICCLKSIQEKRSEFSEEGTSKFPYTATYKTKYTYYKDLISAKMMNDEDFSPERDCDMTALLGKVDNKCTDKMCAKQFFDVTCKEKMKGIPAYWEKVGEWEKTNWELLNQDAESHLEYTIKKQSLVVENNSAEHKNEFNKDKAGSQTRISQTIKNAEANYIAIIERMKEKLTAVQKEIISNLEQVQKAVKGELDEAQGMVYASMDQRLSHMMDVSQSVNLKTGSPEQAAVFPHHNESAYKKGELANEAYAAINRTVQNLKNTLISASQLPEILTGVDALNPLVLKDVNGFLSRTDASMTAQEKKLNVTQASWVDTVKKAKTLITDTTDTINDIEVSGKLSQSTYDKEGQVTSRADSNCAYPEGQDKMAVTDYCCCQMMTESEGRWALVPRHFEDWASCADTKKMTKDAGNYALQAMTFGQMDTGSCNYFSPCPSCGRLDADGKVLFNPSKKRASRLESEHGDFLAKFNLKMTRAAKDTKHLYAKCLADGEEYGQEYKISLDKRECDDEKTNCLQLPSHPSMPREAGYGFVVEDKCCAASAFACSCSLFGSKSCRCKYTGPMPSCVGPGPEKILPGPEKIL